MKVKSIESRTARVDDCITPYHCPCFAYRRFRFILQFRVWLVNNWEITLFDARKEQDLLKQDYSETMGFCEIFTLLGMTRQTTF